MQVAPRSPTLPDGKEARRTTARLKERVLKLPLHPLFVSFATSVLVAGVCACSTAAARSVQVPAAAATAGTHPADVAALQAFAKQIGVSCENEDGRLACIGGKPEVGDYYDIDMHTGCGGDAWFGSVAAPNGAELRDRIAPIDRFTTARVSRGQLLCIQAIGWSGKHASYYYVTTVPGKVSVGCKTNSGCAGFGSRPVRSANKPRMSCALTRNGRPTGACAAGWIRGEDVTRIAERK